ncbi:MAG: hypothetical protein JW384_02574 [Nitrosomonadaceae bacterium]|nr:hypothetical protein [Nitrosomonadaceae bacterium]
MPVLSFPLQPVTRLQISDSLFVTMMRLSLIWMPVMLAHRRQRGGCREIHFRIAHILWCGWQFICRINNPFTSLKAQSRRLLIGQRQEKLISLLGFVSTGRTLPHDISSIPTFQTNTCSGVGAGGDDFAMASRCPGCTMSLYMTLSDSTCAYCSFMCGSPRQPALKIFVQLMEYAMLRSCWPLERAT